VLCQLSYLGRPSLGQKGKEGLNVENEISAVNCILSSF
jgi:hypothetical protein